jgi:NAD(P)-dependent dehydrogenase (short-subunit alcohol dehydrogenase family)
VGALDGQVALVTGAGGGVGQAVAAALAGDGAAVAVAAESLTELRHTAHDITDAGGTARALVVDPTDPGAVHGAVRSIEADLGPITVLVTNVRNPTATAPVAEVDPRAWWRTVKTHFQGPFLCTRAVLPSMTRRGGGRIVNVTSTIPLEDAPVDSAVAAARAAVVVFTERVAREARDHGVVAFSVQPGGAERTAGLVVRLARGEAEALTGRCLDARQDLDALLAAAGDIAAGDALTLRLRAWSPPAPDEG